MEKVQGALSQFPVLELPRSEGLFFFLLLKTDHSREQEKSLQIS